MSGQIPIDPSTGELIKEPFSKASEIALRNLISIVKAAGGDVSNIVKVTVYMVDINKFSEFNTIYSKIFEEHKPARAVIGVESLPKGAELEVEGIAYLGK